MAFIALIKETGERVDILRASPDLIRSFKPGSLACQLCGCMVFPRSEHEREGRQVRSHFVHSAHECPSEYKSHPQSADHREGKYYIATKWLSKFGRYKGAQVNYEVPIHEVKRVADVMAVLPNGHRIAHEVQLVSITPRELEERTRDYALAGVDVYWHLGKDADTTANRAYLASIYSEYCLIRFLAPSQQRV